jgi:hypothetical protein
VAKGTKPAKNLGTLALKDYGTHFDYVKWVRVDAEQRCRAVTQALESAFSGHIERREVTVIVFSAMTVDELTSAIAEHPLVLKPLLAVCNIAGRAIVRDLGIKNVDTYRPRLSPSEAGQIAGYRKSFLPDFVEVPALVAVDRCEFVDKEIRKRKGNWEGEIVAALRQFGKREFVKRRFSVGKEKYELDAASPAKGSISVGVDVKRIEARQDIHKRADEIVNKAGKFKRAFPKGKFGAVVYYPFATEHVNVENRLRSADIDAVSFAGQTTDSIETAVRLLLDKLDADSAR